MHQGLSSKSVQQHQSWLIKENGIKIVVAYYEMKHMSKTSLEVINN